LEGFLEDMALDLKAKGRSWRKKDALGRRKSMRK
jgi:hypothetical protein